MIANLKRQNLKTCNVYIILNKIKEECYGRKQADNFQKVKTATQDSDVECREWLLIDLDPKRPSETSATNAQVELAKKKLTPIYNFLKDEGFEDPIVAFSGNGFHLLYKIHLTNTVENTELIKKFLKTMDAYFSDDDVDVDTSVFNASRICKLYGTMARKGRDSKEQPHRMSRILRIPKSIEPVSRVYIQKVADSLVEERQRPTKYNNYNASEFDLDDWLNKYGLHYRTTHWKDGTKYILECCPFNPNHKGKDAAIFKMNNGSLGFRCFHSSCSGNHWKDLRKLFEPDAYERKWQEQEKLMYQSHNRYEKKPVAPIVQIENRPIFLTARQIYDRPAPNESFIKTGITIIDKKMRGLKKDATSVWSGLRASAKSTVLSQIILNAVQADCRVIAYSGELSDKNFMRWMNQQAAGHHNEPSQYEGYFNTPRKIQEKIANWLGDRFYLYDNQYGNNFEAVIAEIEKQVVETKADLVVLDNLMAFNISSMGYTKWDAQSAFVWKLHEMANKYHIHIAFVAHPKKAQGFLRFDDISGTADIGNSVDCAFVVHRVNNDFKRLSAEMFKWKSDDEVYNGTNVIEIVKDRHNGCQDIFVPLYYEARSKRLKNSPDENIVYGWDDSDGFVDMPEGEYVFE